MPPIVGFGSVCGQRGSRGRRRTGRQRGAGGRIFRKSGLRLTRIRDLFFFSSFFFFSGRECIGGGGKARMDETWNALDTAAARKRPIVVTSMV